MHYPTMNILIIEDEHNAAKELERILLKSDPSIKVLAILDSVEESIVYLSRNMIPDLIFSDIQLADGICFEIFKTVKIKSPIIFCTAYDEFMLEAFDTNAVSYLLKPITEESVAKALGKFKSLKMAFEPQTTAFSIEKITQQLKYAYKTSLLVEQGAKIIPVQVKDIAYFYLEDADIKIVTLRNQRYSMTTTLDELERILDPEIFYRANRQFIINRLSIVNAERYFSRKLVVKLSTETSEAVIVSKAKASDFLRWLGA